MQFLAFLALILWCLPFSVTLAQFTPSSLGGQLSIELDPQYPGPGDPITATLNDYSLNANGASITWFMNQTFVPNSENKRSITFIAGAVGSATDIEARLTFPNGQTLSTKSAIRPLYVDIIVEPQTYTPLFYRGRSLPTLGSTVYLTALVSDADGLVNSSNYTYGWQLNGTALNGGSTRGGNKTEIVLAHGLSNLVAVSVYDPTGIMVARRLIEIPTVKIDLQFYELNSLYGLSHKVMGDPFNLIGSGTTIRVVPYHLDLFSIGSDLYTNWKINGLDQDNTGPDPFEITIQNQTQGSSQITFKLRNLSDLIESAESSLQIQS